MNRQLRTLSIRGPMGFDDPTQQRRYLAATCTCPKCTARRANPEPEAPAEDAVFTAELEAAALKTAADQDQLARGWAEIHAERAELRREWAAVRDERRIYVGLLAISTAVAAWSVREAPSIAALLVLLAGLTSVVALWGDINHRFTKGSK